MDGNFSGVTHDFIVFVYICCPEVYQDIDDEHNIDYEINDYQWIVVSTKRQNETQSVRVRKPKYPIIY